MILEMTTYELDNDTRIEAHVVTEPVTVMLVGGVGYDAQAGEILLPTQRADVYRLATMLVGSVSDLPVLTDESGGTGDPDLV